VILRFEWNRRAAEVYLRKAIALAPGDAGVRQPMVVLLESEGRFDEACRHIDEALDLDPLSKPLQSVLAWLYYYARRYEEGLAVCVKTLEMDPHYYQTLAVQGLIYVALNRYDDAIRVLKQCAPDTYAAYACGLAGYAGEAKELLAAAERRGESAWVAPSALAAACMGVGDHGRALDYLERACDVRDPIMAVLGVLPIFEPLRADARFGKLLVRVGLPASFHPLQAAMSVTSGFLKKPSKTAVS
jgi:tetratricopeptide (TPR) repeat protein